MKKSAMKIPTSPLKAFTVLFCCQALLTLPTVAQAYIGPGAGLSLLGALWALLVAMGAALVFVCAWPIRRLMRRLRADKATEDPALVDGDADMAPFDAESPPAVQRTEHTEPRQ
ncbi:MAG TPA: hypothetical protein VNR18_02970 [Hyphomicrobiales bacterium]|nr:hypothetical protein [Hyphomicrobiales bacterium]